MANFADKINKVKVKLRKYISPVFISLLLLSTLLWYLTKLSYTYETTVPVTVNIEGDKFRVDCIAQGTGYRLVAYKSYRKREVKLRFRDIQTTPSVINTGYYIINRTSLQNAISVRISDLRINSIGDIPEITLPNPVR